MSLIEIENTEVGGYLRLYDLRIKPTFGIQGAGEPTERGAMRMLEQLQKGKDENDSNQFFLQTGLITEFPIPQVRVDAYCISSWSPNEESPMSCLSLIWLVDNIDEVLSADIKSLLKDLVWSDHAGPFGF